MQTGSALQTYAIQYYQQDDEVTEMMDNCQDYAKEKILQMIGDTLKTNQSE